MSSPSQRIGIVGGDGWLGSALIRAALARQVVDPSQLVVSSPRPPVRIVDLPVRWTQSNQDLAAWSDIVILSVRARQFREIDIDLSGKLAISVMAGVGCNAIATQTGAIRIIRAIPNAAAAIGQAFTPWFATPEVTDADRSAARAFIEASGESAEVPLESHVDFCVGLTGSGAAFPALLAEALIGAAVAEGLPRGFAERAARGWFAVQASCLPGRLATQPLR